MITTISPIIQLQDNSANLYYYLIITTKDGRKMVTEFDYGDSAVMKQAVMRLLQALYPVETAGCVFLDEALEVLGILLHSPRYYKYRAFRKEWNRDREQWAQVSLYDLTAGKTSL